MSGVASAMFNWLPVPAGTVFGLAALSLTAGLATLAMAHNLSAAHKTSQYGRLLRVVDPELEAVRLPYLVVGTTGLLSAVLAALVAFTLPLIEGPWAEGFAFGMLAGLASYTFLGLAEVLLIHTRHERRSDLLRSYEERLETANRAREANRKGPGGPGLAR